MNPEKSDWIVVGGGLTGSALAYELALQGQAVVLVEPQDPLQGATRYSYGGIAYWSGTDDFTRYWCDRTQTRYPELTAELEADVHYRSTTLLLTVAAKADPQVALAHYQHFAIPPKLLTPAEAVALEPALSPAALSGALVVPHGHVCPLALVQAYRQQLQHRGGRVIQASYRGLRRVQEDPAAPVVGIETDRGPIEADRVVICAGGMGRSLLRQAGYTVPLYYTQAEVIEIQAQPGLLQGVVMPAENRRFALEAQASQPDYDDRWEQPGQEIVPASLDLGAVQFRGGRLLLGQASRTWSDLEPPLDAKACEQKIREGTAAIFPGLAYLPGSWHRTLVAFSRDGLPFVGEMGLGSRLYLFTGFSSPFVYVPPMAQAFAAAAVSETWADSLLRAVSPDRFAKIP